jgi:hypothetical protein
MLLTWCGFLFNTRSWCCTFVVLFTLLPFADYKPTLLPLWCLPPA